MKTPKKQIVLYLTEEEKEILLEKAKKEKYSSVNSYIKDKIFEDKDTKALAINGFIEPDTPLDGSKERTNVIRASFSDDEYEYMKKIAGKMSLSAYLRKIALEAGGGKYTFEVKTDDIEGISENLSEFNRKIYGIIGAMRFRNELYKSDIQNFERIAEEVNKNIKEIEREVKRDRKEIKRQGIIYLQQQIDRTLAARVREEKKNIE